MINYFIKNSYPRQTRRIHLSRPCLRRCFLSQYITIDSLNSTVSALQCKLIKVKKQALQKYEWFN